MKSYLKIALVSLLGIYVGYALTGLVSELLAGPLGPYAPPLVLSTLLGLRGVVWVIDRLDKKRREVLLPPGATYMVRVRKSLPY